MEITDEKLFQIANLAKLEITDDNKEIYRNDLVQMIGFVDKIREFDESKYESLKELYLVNEYPSTVRSDEVATDEVLAEKIFGQAGESEMEYIKVPRTINPS